MAGAGVTGWLRAEDVAVEEGREECEEAFVLGLWGVECDIEGCECSAGSMGGCCIITFGVIRVLWRYVLLLAPYNSVSTSRARREFKRGVNEGSKLCDPTSFLVCV